MRKTALQLRMDCFNEMTLVSQLYFLHLLLIKSCAQFIIIINGYLFYLLALRILIQILIVLLNLFLNIRILIVCLRHHRLSQNKWDLLRVIVIS